MNLRLQRVANKLDELFKDKIDLSDATGLQEDDWIQLRRTRSLACLAVLMKNSFSIDELVKSIVDGSGDGGLDLIYIDNINKNVYIVQSKFIYKETKGVSKDELLKFFEGIENLLEAKFTFFNPKIQSRSIELKEVLFDDYKIEAIFIQTGKESNTHDQAIKRFVKKINGDVGEPLLSFTIINMSEIYKFSVENNFSKHINVEKFEIKNYNQVSSPQPIYYGLITAKSIVELYKRYNNDLFSSNIRYFKGDTSVNGGIQNTIKKDKSFFHLYNNGIKITCKSITKLPLNSGNFDYAFFKLNDMSIVNGAQTTGALSLFSDAELENVYIFCTIISLENANEQLGFNITTFSNSQNKIELFNFAVMDDFHKDLRRKLNLDNRDYVYAEGDQPTRSEFIRMQELTLGVACYLDVELAATIKNAYGKIFKDLKKPPYTRIFDKSIVTEHFAWNVTTIFNKVNNILTQLSLGKNDLDYSIPIHGNRFIYHIIIQKLVERGLVLSNQYVDVSNLEDKIIGLVQTALERIKAIYITDYPSMIVFNLFRTKKYTKQIKTKILAVDW